MRADRKGWGALGREQIEGMLEQTETGRQVDRQRDRQMLLICSTHLSYLVAAAGYEVSSC